MDTCAKLSSPACGPLQMFLYRGVVGLGSLLPYMLLIRSRSVFRPRRIGLYPVRAVIGNRCGLDGPQHAGRRNAPPRPLDFWLVGIGYLPPSSRWPRPQSNTCRKSHGFGPIPTRSSSGRSWSKCFGGKHSPLCPSLSAPPWSPAATCSSAGGKRLRRRAGRSIHKLDKTLTK